MAAHDGRKRRRRDGRGRSGRTHYDVLELEMPSSSVTLADVKRAYRRLAVKHHPDRNIGNEEEATARFREINEAYEVLSDDDSRREYDASLLRGDSFDNYGGGRGGGSSHGWAFHAGRGGGYHDSRRRRDPFDQFNDVFRNDPFFAESFKSMDDLFKSKFDGSNKNYRGGGRGSVNEKDVVGGERGGWGGGIWSMIKDYIPNVKVTTSTSVNRGGGHSRSSTTSRSYGSSTYSSRSTRTIMQNGRRVTIQSLEKDGNRIEEKYVDDALVERTINGMREDIGRIGGGRTGGGGYEEF
ncbi:hypothetical protein ACHAXA_000005 [Cyclostephanos tholiformis]|uniref:J domain-containing protein n=1 Tax=Cyclostephanos tholiformis TaxID=382380 RepID=A0ABD3R8V3_9STRA